MGNTNLFRHNPQLKDNQAIISLGSNWGDTYNYLAFALNSLSDFTDVIQTTEIMITKPYGYINQPFFLNQLVKIQTTLNPEQLLHKLQTIEKICNRQRNIKNGPRTLDLDIIHFGQQVIKNAILTLPHPAIYNRDYLQLLLKNLA